jgi:DNA-binding NarL/FixJ family response regulator
MNGSKISTGKKPAKILIVDDHPLVREGLAVRIASQPDLKVCGEAADVAEAMERVKATAPDLVIIDLSLKSGHGLDLIKQIRAQYDQVKMLVASMYDESMFAERVLIAGALGYINKQEMPERILDAIRQVLLGKVYLSASMTERVLHRLAAVSAPLEVGTSPVASLSDRELEVFELIGRGVKTSQIASRLHLSVKTIETHREKIKVKLNVKTSTELSRYAVQWVLENG